MTQKKVLATNDLIVPDWPAPQGVKALFTTRVGGVSKGEFASLNLGVHVGDLPGNVTENRRRLGELLPASPIWLNQVHGAGVVAAEAIAASTSVAVEADGSVTTRTKIPCAVLVADCLPVLFCADDGSCVGAAHAGWRGLHRGVLEKTVVAMVISPARILAWLGPAIGPSAFEVGTDVQQAFTSANQQDASAFRPIAGRPEKYLTDIYALARRQLQQLGVSKIFGGNFCTVGEPARFFSYRRDGKTGRMAAVIWID